MHSEEIDSLIRERQKGKQPRRKSQIPYALALLLLSCTGAVFLWVFNRGGLIVFWIVGIALGIVLRYSRFCFAAAFRDPFLTKNTGLMRALLLALMVSTTGFAVIQHRFLQAHPNAGYDAIPGRINSVGLHTVLGAFIFGIGMVLAGGCASGTLMRIGEGHALPWFTLVGFLIGTTLGAKDYPFWYGRIIQGSPVVYFPEYIGFGAAVLIQIAILVCLYWLARRYQDKTLGKEG
ncbi:MAG: YeeE/YedE family protein [Oscillospiraceae bacterium]|jgi:uncharacterized membrane protein YedE/YeeE|nr:YeeE/YedE family protein [Oscillospiraceae bacterium]